MFTRSDLSELSAAHAAFSVSLFLPTEVRGAEVRQNAIRLRNLLSMAADTVSRAGMDSGAADALLAPAAALVKDYDFWQHQDQGLALFLGGDEMRAYRVPLSLTEQMVIGPRFHLKPLLPLLAADGAFRVLTMTADQVMMYSGSRFGLSHDRTVELPASSAEVARESDYENPVQASPVARPHTGSFSIGNAQVYGDSPPEWRKRQLVDLAERVAAAVDAATARQPLPVVLVADAALAGHVSRASTLGPLLAGVIDTNPEALDLAQLHDAAYTVMSPRLDSARREAVDLFAALQGRNDRRAVASDSAVVKAAAQGRVDTLLLRLEPTLWGNYNLESGTVTLTEPESPTGEDLYGRAAVLTAEHGGRVHVLAEQDLPELRYGAAVLRY